MNLSINTNVTKVSSSTFIRSTSFTSTFITIIYEKSYLFNVSSMMVLEVKASPNMLFTTTSPKWPNTTNAPSKKSRFGIFWMGWNLTQPWYKVLGSLFFILTHPNHQQSIFMLPSLPPYLPPTSYISLPSCFPSPFPAHNLFIFLTSSFFFLWICFFFVHFFFLFFCFVWLCLRSCDLFVLLFLFLYSLFLFFILSLFEVFVASLFFFWFYFFHFLFGLCGCLEFCVCGAMEEDMNNKKGRRETKGNSNTRSN